MHAREIVRFVRACDFFPLSSPWGHPTARVGERAVRIAKAGLTGVPASGPPGTTRIEPPRVEVAAADEWVSIERVVAAGRIVPAAAGLEAAAR